MKPFKVLIITLIVFLFSLVPVLASPDGFGVVQNAGIPGYNKEIHNNVSLAKCKQLCIDRTWCKSVDFERKAQKCFVQPVAEEDVGKLKTTYSGHPYDHYFYRPRLQKMVPSTDVQSASNNLKSCDDLRRKIHKVKSRVASAFQEYDSISRDMSNIDKQTRVNLCTKDIGPFSAVATLQFDSSWGRWLSKKSKIVSLLGKIPGAGTLLGKVSKGMSLLASGLTNWESEQFPLDEGWAEYQKVRQIRKETLGGIHRGLQLYYCRNLFAVDQELYTIYNKDIPAKCLPHLVNDVRRQVIINRPRGLPPIWVERNYTAAKELCSTLPMGGS